jgi:hypothetical protein
VEANLRGEHRHREKPGDKHVIFSNQGPVVDQLLREKRESRVRHESLMAIFACVSLFSEGQAIARKRGSAKKHVIYHIFALSSCNARTRQQDGGNQQSMKFRVILETHSFECFRYITDSLFPIHLSHWEN